MVVPVFKGFGVLVLPSFRAVSNKTFLYDKEIQYNQDKRKEILLMHFYIHFNLPPKKKSLVTSYRITEERHVTFVFDQRSYTNNT